MGNLLDLASRGRYLRVQLDAGNEFDVLLDKVESSLQMREQVDQVIAQLVERRPKAAGELRQCHIELVAIAGVDHA